jgi:hypothetical protein
MNQSELVISKTTISTQEAGAKALLRTERGRRRNYEVVHALDTFARADEEPVPIQRETLDRKRVRVRYQWLWRVTVTGSDPRHTTQKRDYEEVRGRVQSESSATIPGIGTFPCASEF